ncbi:serpin family protein [Rhodohalobacter mucosus]|uniref:Serpin family protein n=1 Tax=Rhodohalobacter mucosus TaxID=2079485 RepID=A0A316TMR1_9BACT|nr:serpin family protein [Rhodohalobacter mucosus]PWN05710.1 serpin family protein [Rhodohalobacter mucosus]
MKLVQNLILLTVCLFLFTMCENSITGPDGPKGELPRDLTTGEKLLVEADGSFSYDIFRRTVNRETEKENLMISPLSISMALAMTLNGAQGSTYDKMQQALYLSGMEIEEINEAFRSLTELLVSVDPQVTIRIANSIWYKNGLPVEEEFLDSMRDFFDARVEGIDFDDPASVDIINNWVNENTEGLIEEIVKQIEPQMVMFLINALYFKGDWLRPFDVEDTRKADFSLESGETTEVDMMHQEGRFALYFSDEVRMAEIPYGDSLFTMSVLMPADPDMPIGQFVEENVTSASLDNWRSNLTVDSREITLELPKFEFEYEIKYNDILKAMGMDTAFNKSEANFKGIADVSPRNLYIDEVKHKTFIRVDEKGTEAAAVTSVGFGIESLPPQMIVDRPFAFIIHERESGTNLFMGVVRNP